MLGNIPHKDYTLLRPFLENGMNQAIQGIGYAASGLSELFLIVLFKHRVSGKIRFRLLILLVILLSGLTIGPLTGAISEFGIMEAAKQRYPAYEQWRLVQIGRFIEHLDFLSIYQWLAGAFIRISAILWLIMDILASLFPRQQILFLYVATAAMLAFALLPLSDSTFYHLLSAYLIPLTMSIFIGTSLIIRLITFLAFMKGETNR